MPSAKIIIRRLSTKQADFSAQLDKLLAFEATQDDKLDATVAAILTDVKQRGDVALLEYTQRFDRLKVSNAKALEISPDALRAAFESLPSAQRDRKSVV